MRSSKETSSIYKSRSSKKAQFKSPKNMNVNTISINFGKRGDIQGQYVKESSRPGHKAEPKKSRRVKVRNLDSSDESEASEFLRRNHFRRSCCKEMKVSDHQKPEW